MRSYKSIQLTCVLLTAGLSTAGAAIVYNEATSGDLSNSGLSPTRINVALGSNQIFGTTGRGATAVDLDYFTITIPSGLDLTAITVLPGTMSSGPLSLSFVGLQAGPQVTLPASATTATGLLGWAHYGPGDINTNILPAMAIPSMGSSGFSVPLAAGNYSFWIQELSPGSFPYGFDLTIAQTPEPATYATFLAGLMGIIAVARRRRTR